MNSNVLVTSWWFCCVVTGVSLCICIGKELTSTYFLFQPEYFGLRYLNKKLQFRWVELDKCLKKQLEKHAHAPLLYFGVRFYVANAHRIKDDVTRWVQFLSSYTLLWNSNISHTLVGNRLRDHSDVSCSRSIACRHCSNYSYIFILDLTSDFNRSGKDKSARQDNKFWDWFCLILEVLRCMLIYEWLGQNCQCQTKGFQEIISKKAWAWWV